MTIQTRVSAAERMKVIAREIAAPAADAVDREGRYPREAMAALRKERLLSVLVPKDLGGDGLSLSETTDLVSILARGCSASGLIYAMHNIKLHGLIFEGNDSAWHRNLAARVARDQLLLGSATTEAGVGGNLRNSICAIETDGDTFSIKKDASVISYAEDCDAIFITARRDTDAAPSDQVMVALMKDQYTLEETGSWDTLGMRGTCSRGYILSGSAPVAQIFPLPFAELAAESMLATSHIFWSGAWYGIAQEALSRAQATVRNAARRTPGQTPPAAVPLAEANVKLQQMRSAIKDAIRHYEAAQGDADKLGAVGFAVAMNNLKVASSTLAAEVVFEALRIAGIQGYRNDSPASVGRQLRDVLSAPLMIANDRIVSNLSSLMLVSKIDASLAD